MILIMLGTNPYSFNRLTDKAIAWAKQVDEELIIQSGHTMIEDLSVHSYPFLQHEKVLELMKKAEIVIAQGGFGTLQDCISLGVKTIAVPRFKELGECLDDQVEIVDILAEENLVIPLYDMEDFEKAIQLVRKHKPVEVNDYKLQDHVAETVHTLLEQ